MNSDKKKEEYLKLEGWLEKKSPKVLIGYQKRFFSFTEDENKQIYFLYDKNEKLKDKKPKGAISLGLAQNVSAKSGQKEFEIQFGERKFQLRAPTIQERDKWVAVILYLKGICQQVEEGQQKNKKAGWRFDKLDSTLQKSLTMQREEKKQDESLKLQEHEQEERDEQMRVLKGISNYFQGCSQDFMRQHVISGYLYKKKEKQIQKVIQPRKRWFFMFSECNLEEKQAEISDKPNRQKNPSNFSSTSSNLSDFNISKLPPQIEPNVLYYYNEKSNESKVEGQIETENIVQILKEENQKESSTKKQFDSAERDVKQGDIKKAESLKIQSKVDSNMNYSFSIIVKGKDDKQVMHHFYSHSLLEIERWANSLEITSKYQMTKKQDDQQIRFMSFGESPEISDQEDIILQEDVKIQNKMMQIRWDNKWALLKRRIIYLQKERTQKKDQDYIVLDDIDKIEGAKNQKRLIIHNKKTKQQLKIEFNTITLKKQWQNAIELLLIDQNTSIQLLQAQPKEQEEQKYIPEKRNQHYTMISYDDSDESFLAYEKSFQGETPVQQNEPSIIQRIFCYCSCFSKSDEKHPTDENKKIKKKLLEENIIL